MSRVSITPFLVSSGGKPFSTHGHDARSPSEPRTSTAGPRAGPGAGPQGRRTFSARNLPSSKHQPQGRFRRGATLASNAVTIPEATEKRGGAVVVASGARARPSSSGRKNSIYRQQAASNDATRRRLTVKTASAHISRRGSTMDDILEQDIKQQERVDPIAEDNSIQKERQQRRNRGLNLRLVGDFFGAREKSAQDLFRGLPTLPGQALCSDGISVGNGLWACSNSTEQDFLMSCPVGKVDWFVSHTWARNRRDPMFRNLAEFTGFKATELNNFLEDVTSEKQAARRESGTTSRLDEMLMKVPTEPLVLWIDKFCVSPDILERRLVVEKHMEYFLTNSDGLLVLLSSSYFQRLWCVYEWGCFVVTHGTSTLDRIRVCLSWLCCSATFQIPLLAHDIEVLSVPSLKCSELNDQLYLRSRISMKYTSVQNFQRMIQISALCSVAKACAVLALDVCTAGHLELEEAWRVFNRNILWRHDKFVLPWRSVAAKLGLPKVCSGLDSFWGQMQRSAKMSAEAGILDDGSDLFCVSAPPRDRLRIIANSAAQMHLAVLVRQARFAAVGAEGLAAAAISVATAGPQGPNGGEHGSGSESSGSEEARDRFSSVASEASAW